MADIRINRVVTRGGDGGETSLGNGERVSKASLRIEAIGVVDEVNSALGLLRYHIEQSSDFEDCLADIEKIQSCLFDLGADLCLPDPERPASLPDAAVDWLEDRIETLRAPQEELRSFILPGGSLIAAHAHVLRAMVRRAERSVVALDVIPQAGLRFLNRLSDYLFVLARHANHDGKTDIVWVRGQWQQS